ncbi:HutD family protein [Myroides marinus]|uniref:HutD family protein n=1 Tax=Myroides marinus TaxID=703342 RepID=UPI0025753D3D|nr:HutD family protein [Myroides marinus]MDM1390563.1 HutD family protein [Myroides marinus]
MDIRLIRKEEVLTSQWAGGKTNEYIIYPSKAKYADRDFLFRISSATIEAIPSDFTQFTGYKRYLAMLEGDIRLYKNGKEECYDNQVLFSFESSDDITSYSFGKDFNLMLNHSIKNETVRLSLDTVNTQSGHVFVFALGDNTVTINGNSYNLKQYDCLVIINKELDYVSIILDREAIIGYW